MKFEIGSQWKTRSGCRAVVVEHTNTGLVVWHSNYETRRHAANGNHDPAPSCFDLIEPWVEKKKHDVWVNMYSDSITVTHPSKERADFHRVSNCLACINIKFTEGDGL
jgi:hypothetical protein